MRYYLRQRNNRATHGPLEVEEINAKIQTGELNGDWVVTSDIGEPALKVARSPDSEWFPLAQVQGIFIHPSASLPTSVEKANSYHFFTNNKKTIGIIIAIIGVALIIISPSLYFVGPGHPSQFDPAGLDNKQITDLTRAAKFCGVGLLIVGGIIAAIGFSQSTPTQPTAASASSIDGSVAQSDSPKSVELGNTPGEVESVMGKPEKIINLGARIIHVYKDMKIIYVDGKVSDVQLSN